MNKIQKERLAFWFEHGVMIVVTVASIWFASRIGYAEAIRFSRYEEARAERNVFRAVEHELILNEQVLREALLDVDSETFRSLQPIRFAFERAREGDEFFQLDRETIMALSEAYDPVTEELVGAIREHQNGGPIHLSYAEGLRHQLERIELARPLLHEQVLRLEAHLATFGVRDPEVSFTQPDPIEPAEPSDAELAAVGLPTSPGWTRAVQPAAYEGDLGDGVFWDQPRVPPKITGPTLIRFDGTRLPDGRKPARVHLVFSRRSPFPVGEETGEAEQRRGLAGDRGPDSWVQSHDLDYPADTQRPHWLKWQVLDPSTPLAWRWVYVLMEDDQGDRHVANFELFKIADKGETFSLTMAIDPKQTLLVLPAEKPE